MMLFSRIISLLIGYLCGCVLTAEIVTRRLTGKPCKELGTTGNPGMANVMAHLGFRPGILVLAGDLAKTVVAVLVSMLLFHKAGHVIIYYAALGTTLGHNYPFWQQFHGGKGVAASCAGYFLCSPAAGLLSMIAGMLVVFATGYLGLGAIIIAAVFVPFSFGLYGEEAGIIAVIFAVLMLLKHLPSVLGISKRTTEKVDVLGAIRRKMSRNGDHQNNG
jgi:glycerol-3-phosphate acyltransferase PlsY